MGAYDYIQKPIDFNYLENILLARMATSEAS